MNENMVGGYPMRKKRDDKMNAIKANPQVNREKKVLASFNKAVKANGNALEKLSKN